MLSSAEEHRLLQAALRHRGLALDSDNPLLRGESHPCERVIQLIPAGKKGSHDRDLSHLGLQRPAILFMYAIHQVHY